MSKPDFFVFHLKFTVQEEMHSLYGNLSRALFSVHGLLSGKSFKSHVVICTTLGMFHARVILQRTLNAICGDLPMVCFPVKCYTTGEGARPVWQSV